MEKQHNRGQDGAGVASVRFDQPPGKEYLFRVRSNSSSPIKDVFNTINKPFAEIEKHTPKLLSDASYMRDNVPFAGEVYLGHLRYGTHGGDDISYVHPVMRENNWKTRNLVLAGNFNLANVSELFAKLIELGQFPKGDSDVVTILEKIGHFLDRENQKLFTQFKQQGYSNIEISERIAKHLNLTEVLAGASKTWDGGYTISGILGHGDAFITRDPWGIRPAFYYYDDEIVVAASERAVIQTAMNLQYENVHELIPGTALIVKKNGAVSIEEIRPQQEKKACSFERIYFSRGSDKDIYQERKRLGQYIVPEILKSIDYDTENTVFSFIPNTAETAFYGMMEGVQDYLNKIKKEKIIALNGDLDEKKLDEILSFRPRMEKIALKDVKMRTFITQDKSRDDLVAHVYDITYGVIKKTDNLVIIDDSIVRGTTLKKSIFRILDRLGPKKIIIVSSSPQIRYPDCYGIDMAKLGDLAAFNAAIALLRESGQDHIINEAYGKIKSLDGKPKEEHFNAVQSIYAPFTDEQLSKKIAEQLHPRDINAEIEIIYQSVDGLHKACPNHKGDWYFTGNYPTAGGNKAVNKSFQNYIEGKNERSY